MLENVFQSVVNEKHDMYQTNSRYKHQNLVNK
jgi:hypothetical protein